MELGPKQITSNIIAPGFFPSKLAQGLISNLGGEESLSNDNPLRRLGEPEDIAGVAVFLCSRAGAYVYVRQTRALRRLLTNCTVMVSISQSMGQRDWQQGDCRGCRFYSSVRTESSVSCASSSCISFGDTIIVFIP